MANRPNTLDIKALQILVHVPDDADGYPWHHRVLVLQIKGGRWVSLDPELELAVLDLDTVDYVLLNRNAAFPAEKWNDIFHFEPLPQSEVGGFRRRARTFLALHGDGGIEADELVWVVCDPRDAYFGVIIPQATIEASDSMLEGGSKGIVEHEDQFRFVEQIGKTEIVDTVKKWRSADSDIRILKVQRDAAGNRNRPLSDAVPAYTQSDMSDWPHSGERAFREASDAVLRTTANWKTYHLTWKQESGIGTGTTLCHEHETLLRGLPHVA